ncbi:hypothetical protein CCP3SC1AL1_4600001 [Gammaproteobacteria bacterium]
MRVSLSLPDYLENGQFDLIALLVLRFFEDCYLSNLLQSDDGDCMKRKKIPL